MVKKEWLTWAGAAVVAVGAMFPLYNYELDTNRTRTPIISPMQRAYPEAVAIMQAKCFACHVPDVEKPWYYPLPGAHQVMQADIDEALGKLNMEEAFGREPASVPDSMLVKIEKVLKKGSMPPLKYVALHWSTRLSDHDTAVLTQWLSDLKARKAETMAVWYPGVDVNHMTWRNQPVWPVPTRVPTDPKKVALGQRLYFDTRLSGDMTVSCASCHGLNKGGGDRLATSTGIGGQKGPINAPTVFNAVFNHKQFWDGRAADLVEQAGGPVTNPLEMGATWPQVLTRLKADSQMVAEFKAVYNGAIEPAHIQDAIAEFEKTLVTPDAPFDRFLKGDASAMNDKAKAGWALFKSVGCINCHGGVAMGGNTFERMGLYHDYFADRAGGKVTDVDMGRYNVTKVESDRHKFKVPTLRNVATSYPYFHDGQVTTLDEAVRKMGHYQLDRELTDKEVAELVAFLQSLTGHYMGTPVDQLK
ncbi:MAG: cytochrome c peroxidase [Vampirovibrionales bacterium]